MWSFNVLEIAIRFASNYIPVSYIMEITFDIYIPEAFWMLFDHRSARSNKNTWMVITGSSLIIKLPHQKEYCSLHPRPHHIIIIVTIVTATTVIATRDATTTATTTAISKITTTANSHLKYITSTLTGAQLVLILSIPTG